MALLRQIRGLLHDSGMTIRGAQLALAGKSAAPGGNGVAAPQSAPIAEPSPTAAPSPITGAMPHIDKQALIAIRNRLAAALAA
jgi:hypothetical protein